MSPSTEQEIIHKLDRITFVLLGADGQKNTGFINRTEASLFEHDTRIGRIEKWMWRCIGGGALMVILVEYLWRR